MKYLPRACPGGMTTGQLPSPGLTRERLISYFYITKSQNLDISRKFSDQRERIGARRAVARIWLWPQATLKASSPHLPVSPSSLRLTFRVGPALVGLCANHQGNALPRFLWAAVSERSSLDLRRSAGCHHAPGIDAPPAS